MIIEERILDFLDGNLSPEDEEELLHRLAVSPERRAVLKQHLQVRELSYALSKKHNYIVPKIVTAQLFHSLAANGYAGPNFQTPSDHVEALEASLAKNLNRSAETVVSSGKRFASSSLYVSSILSFLIGAVLMYFYIPGISTNAVADVASASPSVVLQVSGDAATRSTVELAANTSSQEAVYNTDEVISTASKNTSFTEPTQQLSQPVASRLDDNSVIPAESHIHIDAVKANITNFADRTTTIDLPSSPAVLVSSAENNTDAASADNAGAGDFADNSISTQSKLNNTSVNSDVNAIFSRSWWEGNGMFDGDASTEQGLKSRFGIERHDRHNKSLFDRTTAAIRSGGGRAPGNPKAVSGSLVEMKFSADLNSWLVAKVSFGNFMPYETEALNAGYNADGVRQLELVSVQKSKQVVGAELGFRFRLFDAPIEVMGGVLSDLRDALIPRASIFSHFMLAENLSVHLGAEAVLYTHDIRPSLANQQKIFGADHPVLVSPMRASEVAGFVGPAIELAWHF